MLLVGSPVATGGLATELTNHPPPHNSHTGLPHAPLKLKFQKHAPPRCSNDGREQAARGAESP